MNTTMEQNNQYSLDGKKIAILTADGFEQIELTSPKDAIELAGGIAHIISPSEGKVKGKTGMEWGDEFTVDQPLSRADAAQYDGLLIPGGVINPDTLRVNEEALSFVRSFFDAGKPVASICHGPQVLIDAEVVAGKKITSVKNIRMDLIHAGADWVDESVVVDQGLVTSRTPEDLADFNRKMVEEFAEGKHSGQQA